MAGAAANHAKPATDEPTDRALLVRCRAKRAVTFDRQWILWDRWIKLASFRASGENIVPDVKPGEDCRNDCPNDRPVALPRAEDRNHRAQSYSRRHQRTAGGNLRNNHAIRGTQAEREVSTTFAKVSPIIAIGRAPAYFTLRNTKSPLLRMDLQGTSGGPTLIRRCFRAGKRVVKAKGQSRQSKRTQEQAEIAKSNIEITS